jgi:hypothetical protein
MSKIRASSFSGNRRCHNALQLQCFLRPAQLHRFAAETLPKVLRHLLAAQTIYAELTGAAIR